jgi:hypothetical protein
MHTRAGAHARARTRAAQVFHYVGCKLWFCHPSVICGQEFFSGNASVTLHRLWWHTFMQMCATPSMACLGAERAQSANFEAHEMISGAESYHQRLYASQVGTAQLPECAVQ